MSLDRCEHCDAIVDTDEFPNAYPFEEASLDALCVNTMCICENCQERAYDRQQEKLMEEI